MLRTYIGWLLFLRVRVRLGEHFLERGELGQEVLVWCEVLSVQLSVSECFFETKACLCDHVRCQETGSARDAPVAVDEDTVCLVGVKCFPDEQVACCEVRQDVLLAVIEDFIEDKVLDVAVLHSLRWCHSDDVSDAVLLHGLEASRSWQT